MFTTILLKKFIPTHFRDKIHLITILFLTSCSDMTMKEYNYYETSMQTYYDSTSPKEQKSILIKAKSDSEAYIKAYLNFCIATKFYIREFNKSGARAGEPISFRLLNDNSIDIAETVSITNKKELEKQIEKRVQLLK